MSLGGNLPFVFVQGGLMVVLPLALWLVAARPSRLGRRSWVVIGVGCLFFVASQIVNTPLRLIALGVGASGWTLLAALALISGFGEELMRWLGASQRINSITPWFVPALNPWRHQTALVRRRVCHLPPLELAPVEEPQATRPGLFCVVA